MQLHQRIVLNNLLLRREEGFAHVYHCEREIEAILEGHPYPFPAPPELPSTRKAQKSAKPKKTVADDSAPKIRSLRKDEHAYRITYLDAEDTVRTELTPHTAIARALTKAPGIRVQEIVYLPKEDQP